MLLFFLMQLFNSYHSFVNIRILKSVSLFHFITQSMSGCLLLLPLCHSGPAVRWSFSVGMAAVFLLGHRECSVMGLMTVEMVQMSSAVVGH